MKTVYYKQCRLRKTFVNGSYQETTSWIPEEFAVLNSHVKLKDNQGNWTDGWKVMANDSPRLSEEELPDSYKQIKSHRKNTKDSERS